MPVTPKAAPLSAGHCGDWRYAVYEGVCSLVGFDVPDLDGLSVFDPSPADEQSLKVMSREEMESACAMVREVDERRKAYGRWGW